MNIDYRNPNYHYEMGLAQNRLKDSTAINRFISAFQLDRTHQKAIYQIAKHYLKRGRFSLVDHYTEIGLENYENNVELISLKRKVISDENTILKRRSHLKNLQNLANLPNLYMKNSVFAMLKIMILYALLNKKEALRV